MSFNLAQIRNTVRERGSYQRSGKFTDAYVNTEIQSAFGEFYELVEDVNEGYWDTDATVSTVSTQAYVAGPTDKWKIKAVDILNGSDYTPLDQVTIKDRNRWGAGTAKPAAYRLTARGIDLYPTPNAVYTLRVTYAPVAPTLDDTTARDYYNGWEEYVITAALFRLDQREERPLNDRMVVLAQCKARITRAATGRQQNGPEYLNLHDGSDRTYEDPF